MTAADLFSGQLFSSPDLAEPVFGKHRPLAKAWLRVDGLAKDGAILSVQLVSWSEVVTKQFAGLGAGDRISVSGKLTIGAWRRDDGSPYPSATVVVDAVIAPPNPHGSIANKSRRIIPVMR